MADPRFIHLRVHTEYSLLEGAVRLKKLPALCEAAEMPAVAVERLLAGHDLVVGDIDVWEVNEAFAGVVLASCRRLGLPPEAVNVHGGAIALGHPLAASGFRLVLTLARSLQHLGARRGIATMCGGGGQGAAVLLEATS